MKKIITTYLTVLPNSITSIKDNPISYYSCLQRKFILPDRFGFLNEYYPINNLAKTHDYEKVQKLELKNINEIIDNRCFELYNLSVKNNKPIFILWSGGVDSTCVVSSFIKNIKDLSNITIVYSEHSIEEYPLFFDNFIKKNNFKLIEANSIDYVEIYSNCLKNGYTITGDCADQMFGSDLEIRYKNFLDYSWQDFCLATEATKECVEKLEECFQKNKIFIGSTVDFLWWMNYSCKWNYVANSLKLMCSNFYENEIAFFDTDYFSKYSLSIEKKDINDKKSYKLPLKNYSFDLTKDSIYLKYKGKVNSSKSNNTTDIKAVFNVLFDDNTMDCNSFDINLLYNGNGATLVNDIEEKSKIFMPKRLD